MVFKEVKQNLFSIPNDYYLAHCISDDFVLGKGIAVEFNKRYQMRKKLRELYPDSIGTDMHLGGAGCILVDKVFNLITKEKYYFKPTYGTLKQAIEPMVSQCIELNIKKLAMPKIGCGLDKLEWDKVKEILVKYFKDIDIEILVCSL